MLSSLTNLATWLICLSDFSEGLEMPNHEQHPFQNNQITPSPKTNYDHEPFINGQALFNAKIVQGLDSHPATNEEVQQSF